MTIQAGQTLSVNVADHCLVTIRRPNGDIEIVPHNTIREMNAGLLKRANAAMRDAGRGEIISYVNVTRATTYTVTAADAATDSTASIERAMRAGE